MRTDTIAPIQLADYRPFPFRIDSVELDISLSPHATRVRSLLTVTRTGEADAPLVLDGVRLKMVSVAIDDVPVAVERLTRTDEHLSLRGVPDHFVLATEVEIDPEGNTALEGLYMSGGRFCTQCEAEGFRKITYYPDRPDVLSTFRVRVEADRAFAHLLSNGNRVEQGVLPGGRHFAVWSDPFPKPCYLFALVAGELDVLEDSFTTVSGREVALAIYVDPGQAPRAAYAMDALKRSMRWDEEAYGREYDLDLFMIVAVRDFNFGAMENKGLNIFNSSLLLADEATATDTDFERIESVVAHEYFHNWTGNRITCRDWFQLCLKEGLTVFRDQSFSADMRGEAVQRIKDVKMLRARQFPEDAGPMAHPVRPSSYVKIDNFYTATIYEKGAEVIRMLKTLIGPEAFRAGMDLYFERWDGHATTVDAFIACFAEASGRDLGGFFAWYEQAGTPDLDIRRDYDAETGRLTLTLAQSLRGVRGRTHTLVLDQPKQSFVLEGVAAPPVLSALRGFSAPVNLTTDAAPTDGYVLMAADPDLFNRWEAGQALARGLILARTAGRPDETGEARFAEALGRALADEGAGDAFRALMLGLPTESDLVMAVDGLVDPWALHDAREALRMRISAHLAEPLRALHTGLQMVASFSPDAEQAGRRALRNAVLDLMVAVPDGDAVSRAVGHFAAARNMTDQMGGLSALTLVGGEVLDRALAAFYDQWKTEPLVIDKWFAVQARSPAPDAFGRVLGLTAHPDFDSRNPNRLRALVMGFAVGNPYRFHAPDGEGYRFLTDQILAADAVNPSVAARMVEPLSNWARFEPGRAEQMRQALTRVLQHPGLSKNVAEIASRAMGR